MCKKLLFIIMLSGVFLTNGFSQKIKLRLDIGNSTNFSSYRPKLFGSYRYAPVSTSEYSYTKLTRFSLMPNNIGLSVEYDYKKRNHFSFGFILGDIISLKDKITYNFTLDDKDSVEYVIVTPWADIDGTEILLNKLNFSYARDFGNGRIRFSPFIGFSFAWVGQNVAPHDTIISSSFSYSKDYLYPSSKFYVEGAETVTDHTSTLMGSVGINLRLHSKKRELFSLRLYYEQGFRTMAMSQKKVFRNNKSFIINVNYSYGSALYLKLSIPIPIYNFDKKRQKKKLN